jgi:hypothetical protein
MLSKQEEAVFGALEIEGVSRQVLTALLDSTAVARRGETTLIPRSSLLDSVSGDFESLTYAVKDLMRARAIENESDFSCFVLLDEIRWEEGGDFLHYQLNRNFLALLLNPSK